MTKSKHPSTQKSKEAPRRAGALLAYAQLFRLPNVFTAMADIAAGYLFVHVQEGLRPWHIFALLVAASTLLYTAGMVLNDVFDYEQDRRERPDRPLPSGRISRNKALVIGWVMLLAGVAIAWVAGHLRPYPGLTTIEHSWRAGTIATLLAGMIVAYDRWLKRTPLGPVAMGSCRALNLLLGMSTASRVWCNGPPWTLHYEMAQLLIAGGMGVYVAGITWFARTEARDSSRLQLSAALATMIAGLALVASYAWIGSPAHFPQGESQAIAQMRILWPLLIMLISVTIVRRAAMAVQRPIPSRVQQAVKTAILSIILLDAAIAMLSGPAYAIGVLLLLVPTLLLARWVYST